MRKLALGFAAVSAFFTGLTLEGCKEACVIGSEGCDCTAGGACDPGLQCLSKTCVNAGPNFEEGADAETGNTDNDDNDDNTDDPTGDGDGDTSDDDPTGDGDGDGPKLDTIEDETDSAETGDCVETGCKKVDMLFALDGSLSMTEEINALKAQQAFLGIVDALEGLNCGGIEYRIGVTGDNNNGWITPNGWANPKPWFDSADFSPAEIAVHFQNAATVVGNSGGASLGCEHVLSSTVALLATDQSGFIRDDALLVIVLMTDVDDYGWYDQIGGHTCGQVGCATPGQPVATLQNTLVTLKDGDPAGLAAIVIAGDPMANGGVNLCGQPQSCGAPTSAFHAERLYEFAGLQEGMNGFTADICAGAAAVPQAVEAALTDNIDLACQEFEPVG
jgi:hypothetical protein